MYPFHIWLPEAHVEAPIGGSVVLAGLLLKLGGFGFIRYSLNLFPEASLNALPIIYLIGILGIAQGAFSALCQVDMKRVVAYSSVVHMNVILLGLFSFSIYGLAGGMLLMLAHGIISSALFILVGLLYYRYNSRIIYYFGGLSYTMPQFCGLFFFFTIANFTFPLTPNFVGELLTVLGLVHVIKTSLVFVFAGAVLTLTFTILMYVRVANGTLNTAYISRFTDLSLGEFAVLSALLYVGLLFTLYPNFTLNYLF
jgi:NADH:ubiquinone oxidoreductase subunit 4 (subunit M)